MRVEAIRDERASRCKTMLFLGLARWFSHGFDQEKIKRRSARVTIHGVGRLLELDALQQPLDVAGDGVGGHNQRCVHAMDVVARYGALGVEADMPRDLRATQTIACLADAALPHRITICHRHDPPL